MKIRITISGTINSEGLRFDNAKEFLEEISAHGALWLLKRYGDNLEIEAEDVK